MAEDVLDNERNPKMPQGNGGYTVYGARQNANSDSGSRLSNFGKKFAGFVKNNKGKIIGFGSFGGISIVLMMFGSMLSGAMQIVHAGQVIGEVIDTARELTTGRRVARNVYKVGSGKTAATAAQNSRTGVLMSIPTRNFEKKLADAGFSIESGKITGVGTGVNTNKALQEFADAGGELIDNSKMTRKQMVKALGQAVDDMPGNTIYKAIMKRNLKKMYKLRWYEGIERAASSAFDNAADNVVTKLSKWVANRQVKTAEKLSSVGAESASKAIKAAADDSLERIAKGALTEFGEGLAKVIAKGAKAIPILGTVIGIVADFAIAQYFDAEKVQDILMSAMIKSAEIATAADNIQSGNIPEEDEDGNYVSSQAYLEMIALQNIYRSYDAGDAGGVASLSDSVYAASGQDCSGIIIDDYNSEEEYNEARNKCLDEVLAEIESEINDASASSTSTTTVGSSFFSNAPLQAEFDSNYSAKEGTAEYYAGVPTQVVGNVGVDKSAENLANALVAAITIIGPKDISDMMEETFDADTLDPAYVGGTAMYGARVQQNALSTSEGARALTQSEEASLLRETQTYLAEQQMEKSLWARLFDVEDYHSGIATLSRDANWDLSDSSITTQFANVVKTFAALPNLIANSFGTYTRAASAASPTVYNYGFNMVAYTTDQVDAEPDYWDAETFLLNNLDGIEEETVQKCTGATISKDGDSLKVVWSETDKYVMEISNSDDCSSYFSGGTFTSEDAYGNVRTDYSGDDAVRSVLANYKTMSAFAATSYDELTDAEITEALEGTGVSNEEAEKMLTQAMKDQGVDYSATRKTGVGDGNIVTAASDADGLSCGIDCVVFVNSVFDKAGKPRPLGGTGGCPQGDAGRVSNYVYCNGYTAEDSSYSPAPGDVIVWGEYFDGCWISSRCHVGIHISGTPGTSSWVVSEDGKDMGCSNLNSTPWYWSEIPTGYVRYVGGG